LTKKQGNGGKMGLFIRAQGNAGGQRTNLIETTDVGDRQNQTLANNGF